MKKSDILWQRCLCVVVALTEILLTCIIHASFLPVISCKLYLTQRKKTNLFTVKTKFKILG
jgi:hypothetical protein